MFFTNFLVSENFAMNPLLSLHSSSTESDAFHVERSSEEGSPAPENTPAVLNSTQLSGAMARETTAISSVASLEPQIVTNDSDSNEPTIPNEFGSQNPIVPSNLNDINLPPNPFKVLATVAVIRAAEEYSPQSPEPSIPSPISTPPMNVSTIEGWETTDKTTDDAIFLSEDEATRVYWNISSSKTFDSNEQKYVSIASTPPSTTPPPRRQKASSAWGFFPKKERRNKLARHAVSPYQPQIHPNEHDKLKHYTLLIKLLTTYYWFFLKKNCIYTHTYLIRI